MKIPYGVSVKLTKAKSQNQTGLNVPEGNDHISMGTVNRMSLALSSFGLGRRTHILINPTKNISTNKLNNKQKACVHWLGNNDTDGPANHWDNVHERAWYSVPAERSLIRLMAVAGVVLHSWANQNVTINNHGTPWQDHSRDKPTLRVSRDIAEND